RGLRDRLAAASRDDGVALRPPRLAIPARSLRRPDRVSARAAARGRRAAGVRRGCPRRLVGNVADAADPAGSGRPVLSLAAAGALLAARARRAELPAASRRS